MADVAGRFFGQGRSAEPLSTATGEEIFRKVGSLELSLLKVIQVRGDTDGKTVEGAKILGELKNTLRQALSLSPQKPLSSTPGSAAIDDHVDVTISPAKP